MYLFNDSSIRIDYLNPKPQLLFLQSSSYNKSPKDFTKQDFFLNAYDDMSNSISGRFYGSWSINIDSQEITRVDCGIYQVYDIFFLQKSTRNSALDHCCDQPQSG